MYLSKCLSLTDMTHWPIMWHHLLTDTWLTHRLTYWSLLTNRHYSLTDTTHVPIMLHHDSLTDTRFTYQLTYWSWLTNQHDSLTDMTHLPIMLHHDSRTDTRLTYQLTLIERNPTPRGGSRFTMFPDQEPEGGGPPSKNLFHVLRGGSCSSGFLIREHSQ